jgi:rod shape determining protein RodA
MITVGSGEILGKGIGYGTQSRLNFLPEYETDFIFAAFAEEWGYVGVVILFLLYSIVLWRILSISMRGETNFEILYGTGLSILFMTHLTINIGMNIGIMPVTGIPVPFMSYGGSHIVSEFLALGILMGMKNYARAMHREVIKNEFVGA